ncbi:unnamed protein product [Schistosoma margrebowiei]|uniref:Uncharacterized protein n=1 Tax=Schistosoma margrebowiei TaxID=48269 RepID=A0A183N3W1_9TREM|nr:unnamed protein product [Schistosoma margrebowiei]
MEDNWKGIKGARTSTFQEALGLKNVHHEEWIFMEILHKIQETKKKKAINNIRTRIEKIKAQAEYTKANKQVKTALEMINKNMWKIWQRQRKRP